MHLATPGEQGKGPGCKHDPQPTPAITHPVDPALCCWSCLMRYATGRVPCAMSLVVVTGTHSSNHDMRP
jgi:hypothetical protein